MNAFRKEYRASFIDFSGGVNTSDDSLRIRKNQVQDASNFILRENGVERRPGMGALASFDLASTVKGLWNYKELAGTENLLMMCGGKLYSIEKTTGADTELYDLTGTGQAYFADYLDKCWITNGTKVVKVENNLTTYQVGLAAPTGATAAALAGGSLPAGVYAVYISYARKVTSNKLYSVAQSLGNVTLSGGNGSIRISTFANSADPQVNNKVVWMTDANGSTVYFYHETGNNTTTTVDVTSATAKVSTVLYQTAAVNNNYPGDGTISVFEYIVACDGRIWGSYQNTLYYSLRNTENVYDMERFFPLNKNVYPYAINGLFTIGNNVFLNTKNGIIKQPADVNEAWSVIDARFYFYHMNTVRPYLNGVIGLTNNGVKFFDGEKFYDYDISYDIRSEIEKIYASTAGFTSCAEIYRRDIRTEYHLCYNDDSLTTVTNNARLVLNLNKLEFLPAKKVIAPWELWTNGATHMAVDSSNVMFCAQSHASAPKLYKEVTTNTYDSGIYQSGGTIGTSTTEIAAYVITRTIMPDIRARVRWNRVSAILKQAKSTTITVYIRDVYGRNSAQTFGSAQGSTLWASSSTDEAGFTWDVDVWDAQVLASQFMPLPMNLEGGMMYVKIEQTANDKDFNCVEVAVDGILHRTRFT